MNCDHIGLSDAEIDEYEAESYAQRRYHDLDNMDALAECISDYFDADVALRELLNAAIAGKALNEIERWQQKVVEFELGRGKHREDA